MTSISVVIPTHNRAKMLKRAIDSVLAQTYQDFELIVVSDGSTDKTEAVVAAYKDPRIKLLKHERPEGASSARNTGINVCKGKYIAFLDDDDEWLQEKLEKQIDLIKYSPPEVGLVYSWMECVENEEVTHVRDPALKGYIFPHMLDKQAITNSSTLLIKRTVLDVVRGFDEDLPRGNDGDFIRRITKHFHVDFVPEVLVKVHVGHMDRISVNSVKNLKNVIHALKKRLVKFEAELEVYPDKKAIIFYKIGVNHFKLGRYAEALSNIRKSISYKKNYTQKLMICLKIIRLILSKLYKDIRCDVKITFKQIFTLSSQYSKYILKFIFDSLPDNLRAELKKVLYEFSWRKQIYIRHLFEFFARFNSLKSKPPNKFPSLILMTGMPRTGSSLMKNYFGDYPGLKIMPFERRGFHISWEKTAQEDDIIVDKSTHYIRNLKKIIAACGKHVAICCIIRDPRDQLRSLIAFDRHPELPRSKKFWMKWYKQYSSFFKTAQKSPENKFFLIRYEDLVRYPKEAKIDFIKWIGLNVKSEIITPSYKIAHADDRQDTKVIKKNKIEDKSIGNYKNIQNSSDVKLIESFSNFNDVSSLMADFGYNPFSLEDKSLRVLNNIHFFTPNEYVCHQLNHNEK